MNGEKQLKSTCCVVTITDAPPEEMLKSMIANISHKDSKTVIKSHYM